MKNRAQPKYSKIIRAGEIPVARVCAMLFATILLCVTMQTARAARQFAGVCSVVGIEIAQELSLERVGFLATLNVTNNEGDATITNFSALLTFETTTGSSSDEAIDASDSFYVQSPDLSGISSIDGEGIIQPGQTATVTWFIIPKVSAGGSEPTGIQYRVGAELAGMVYGEQIDPETLEVIADTITVKPDPQLKITYFQPRDVDGDNPFTLEVVEAPIPFTLGVLIQNVGYGPARKVKIESEQPRVVDNKNGLLVVPYLVGSRIDDNPTNHNSLTVDFGDIEPGKCRKGAWDMVVTLSGEFTEFSATYTHAPELGGRDTSVIQELEAWFIVQEVRNDQPGRDTLLDFLAVTDAAVPYPGVEEAELIPDTMYETDCNTVPVNFLLDSFVSSYADLTAVVDVTADIEDWVFIRVDDPAQGRLKIDYVLRSDGKIPDENNAWTHRRYTEDTNEELNFLNIFDFVALGSYQYSVVYSPTEDDSEAPLTTLLYSGYREQLSGTDYVRPETQLFFLVDDINPVSTWVRLDQVGEFEPAYPFHLTVPGEHLVEFYSEDLMGNREVTQSRRVIVSDEYPTLATVSSSGTELYLAVGALSLRPDETSFAVQVESTAATLSAVADVYRGTYAAPALLGVPSSPTRNTSASIVVSGENLNYYQYRINGGGWSVERSVAEAIELTSFSGSIQLEVKGRNEHGGYDGEESLLSASWTVSSSAASTTLTALQPTPSRSLDAVFQVSNVDLYRYTYDASYFRAETPITEFITLSSLSEQSHTVEVIGKVGSAAWQSESSSTKLEHRVDPSYGHRFSDDARVYSEDLGEVLGGSVTFYWDGLDDYGAPVPAGWYTLRVTVTDGLGRSSSSLQHVYVGTLLSDIHVLSDSGSADQDSFDCRGTWAVWQDQRSGNWDIRVRNLKNGTADRVLTGNGLNHKRPRTDGRYVVWEDRQTDGNWDILGWDLEIGTEPFLVTQSYDYDDIRPAISWPWVVWQRRSLAESEAKWQVMVKHLQTGEIGSADP